MARRILVIGLPGSGKTTWVKERLGDGIVYDLDYLKAALRYKQPHDEDIEFVRKIANSLLIPIIIFSDKSDCDVYIVRTAPKLSEINDINPDELVVLRTSYSITNRTDYHELDGETLEDLNSRINACVKWASHKDITIHRVKGDSDVIQQMVSP